MRGKNILKLPFYERLPYRSKTGMKWNDALSKSCQIDMHNRLAVINGLVENFPEKKKNGFVHNMLLMTKDYLDSKVLLYQKQLKQEPGFLFKDALKQIKPTLDELNAKPESELIRYERLMREPKENFLDYDRLEDVFMNCIKAHDGPDFLIDSEKIDDLVQGVENVVDVFCESEIGQKKLDEWEESQWYHVDGSKVYHGKRVAVSDFTKSSEKDVDFEF